MLYVHCTTSSSVQQWLTSQIYNRITTIPTLQEAQLLVCLILVATAKESCQICGDVAAGFHCGAFVCEACKKFYIRTSKQTNRNQQCSGRGSNKGNCQITRANRTSCTYCRYQKCLNIGMEPPGQCTIVACDWSPERWWLDDYTSFFFIWVLNCGRDVVAGQKIEMLVWD